MITIVTGGIDRGKTTAMIALYEKDKKGGGFASCKCFSSSGEFMGYEIRRLDTGEAIPLALKNKFIPALWDEAERIGPFSFSRLGFDFARHLVDQLLTQGVQPVYIDEIGPMELKERGFAGIFRDLLAAQCSLVTVVRAHCLEEVVNHFKISNYKIISVNNNHDP